MPFDDTMFLKQQVDVLGFFDPEQLRKVTPDIIHNKYKKGQIIIISGEITSSFYIVKNGNVDIFTKENPKVASAQLKKGDFFGVMSMFQIAANLVSIKAAEDGTEVIEIPSQSFEKLLEMQPMLKNALLEKVKQRLPPAPTQNAG